MMGACIILILLVSASCQKASDSDLQSCNNECKAKFDQEAGKCSTMKSPGDQVKCKMDRTTDYNECVSKCNADFIKTNEAGGGSSTHSHRLHKIRRH